MLEATTITTLLILTLIIVVINSFIVIYKRNKRIEALEENLFWKDIYIKELESNQNLQSKKIKQYCAIIRDLKKDLKEVEGLKLSVEVKIHKIATLTKELNLLKPKDDKPKRGAWRPKGVKNKKWKSGRNNCDGNSNNNVTK